jgi:uncharacterized membrane protein YedE/YeeE
MKSGLAAFASGLLFAAGLCLSGMVRPSKVLGFLDVAGRWDPTLLLVMASALAVAFAAQVLARRLTRPFFGPAFPPPAPRSIDAQLVVGSAIFGIGWGLAGYCPGPAVVAAAGARSGALPFVAAMLLGMLLAKGLESASPRTSKLAQTEP